MLQKSAGGTEEKNEILTRTTWSLGRDLNSGSQEMKSVVIAM
jgi:hypothetical protein